jgi:hypothetical protein
MPELMPRENQIQMLWQTSQTPSNYLPNLKYQNRSQSW